MRIKTILSLLFPLLMLPPVAWTSDQPDLLLLTKDPGDVDVSGWYMSEKLDGVRAYWNGSELLSRQGNAFAAPLWFTAGLPPFELDGELWTARGEFEVIVSIASRDRPHPGWKRITYNIFEVPNTAGDFDTRLGRLRGYLAEHPAGPVRIIPWCHAGIGSTCGPCWRRWRPRAERVWWSETPAPRTKPAEVPRP